MTKRDYDRDRALADLGLQGQAVSRENVEIMQAVLLEPPGRYVRRRPGI